MYSTAHHDTKNTGLHVDMLLCIFQDGVVARLRNPCVIYIPNKVDPCVNTRGLSSMLKDFIYLTQWVSFSLLAFWVINPNLLGILARNQNTPVQLIFKMHHPFPLIFHGLYFLPGSKFGPFEEVKVPVSNGADSVFKKSAPWRILEDFGGFGGG